MHHKPFVLTEHAGDFAGWIAPYSRRLLVHWTIKQADCVMPVSHALQRNIERAGMAASFTVVPNIINTRMFHPADTPRDGENPAFHLLWLGGYVKNYWVRKGGPELLHAIALARPHIPQGVRLTLIVDGPARVVSEVLAQRLGILDICTFPGMMKNIEVRDWIQRCDAVIMTSRSESFGVVLIEAMGCGKPVIATRCGGPQEVVTSKTGILVPPRDVQAMADAVVQMAQTYQTYDAHQIASYVDSTFGPQAVVRRLNQVYADVCAAYPAGSGRPVLP
jgi:glycosyltransferase involved in cell wall biosynthesis